MMWHSWGMGWMGLWGLLLLAAVVLLAVWAARSGGFGVRCHAERWRAWTRTPQGLRPGDRVKVVGAAGLSLEVKRLEPSHQELPTGLRGRS
jgi:membrane-bound ClpP family serine protease